MPMQTTPPGDTEEQVRVGATLSALREARALRVGELAKTMKISHAYLSNIEAGRRPLTPQLAVRAADALAVRPIALLRPDHFSSEVTR